MKQSVADFLKQFNNSNRSLDPFAGEVIGARLMHRLGIGSPEVIEVAGKQDVLNFAVRMSGTYRYDTREWICKPIPDARSRAKVDNPLAVFNIMIKRIPGAISVYSLREKYGVIGEYPLWIIDSEPDSTYLQELHRRSVQQFRYLLYHGVQELRDPDAFFSDFLPPQNWDTIREAISWNSDQRLLISAARCFLGCTASHNGNVLVDNTGRLYSIDHEFCAHTDTEELEVLSENLRRGTRAHRAVQKIAALPTVAIESLFEDLPTGILCWPLGSKQETVAYFLERLTRWRSNFALQTGKQPHSPENYGLTPL